MPYNISYYRPSLINDELREEMLRERFIARLNKRQKDFIVKIRRLAMFHG